MATSKKTPATTTANVENSETPIDVMDTKTIFSESLKKAIRKAELQIPFITNNKALLVRKGDNPRKVENTRAVKIVIDNKNKTVKTFQGSAPEADNHCQNYPHRAYLVTHESMEQAVSYAIKTVNASTPIIPVKTEEKTEAKKQEPKQDAKPAKKSETKTAKKPAPKKPAAKKSETPAETAAA